MKDEKGFVAIFIVILTPIFLLLLGVVIDIGWMVVNYNMLENATDASLRSGLYSVDQTEYANGHIKFDEDKARELVEDFLARNCEHAELESFEVEGNTIKVKTSLKVEFIFLKVIDIDSKTIESDFEITLNR